MKRISSIDATRGIVMIIMALDHVRDFMHVNSLVQNPTNLQTTTPALFFTRWITHICAPTFVFLAGTSAYLALKRTNDFSATRKFLLSRGAWLILLEFTVINFIFWFDIKFRTLIFEVIGTIGFGMIILSFLIRLHVKTIALTGIAIIVLHGLFPMIPLDKWPMFKAIASPFFLPGAIPVMPNLLFLMTYPPLPWLGIMLAGFAAGKLFERDVAERNRLFLRIGLLTFGLFIVTRLLNFYGDPSRWTVQKDSLYTILSFMNLSKYPPSLLFTMATIGITFLLLSFTGRMNNRFTAITSVYGSVPLFYFILHFFIIHTSMVVLMLLQGFNFHELVFSNMQFGRPVGKSGVSLAVIYLIWITVVIMLYPVCKWYSRYKSAHRDYIWLRYL